MQTGIQWRKSSYSSDQGGNCVECAPLGQLAWRKSSYSGDQGGNCIEIAEGTGTRHVAVRDSKAAPTGPSLTLSPTAFADFVNWASA
ncbi:DUF397 domain-containing protein [Streptomyces sp. NPDC003717]|uniref:DUF397 domain-containing protein n=1 Tax=Streptomyces sp. NPDC003717 TaxID=3154276 RepID=UPI0033AB45B5